MKRVLFVCLIVLVLFGSFVIAAEDSESTSGAKEKLDETLEKEVQIPDGLKIWARVVFGLKKGAKIDFQRFIILTALFLIAFVLIKRILSLTPIFEEDWIAWSAAVVVALLVGISGGFIYLVEFLFDLLKGGGFLSFTIILLVLGAVLYFGLKFLNYEKNRYKIEKSERMGNDLADAAKKAKIDVDSMK